MPRVDDLQRDGLHDAETPAVDEIELQDQVGGLRVGDDGEAVVLLDAGVDLVEDFVGIGKRRSEIAWRGRRFWRRRSGRGCARALRCAESVGADGKKKSGNDAERNVRQSGDRGLREGVAWVLPIVVMRIISGLSQVLFAVLLARLKPCPVDLAARVRCWSVCVGPSALVAYFGWTRPSA